MDQPDTARDDSVHPDTAHEGPAHEARSESIPGEDLLRRVELSRLPGSATLLQSPLWAEFKGEFGWTPYAFETFRAEPLLVLHRRLAPAASLAYIPHGLGQWEDLPWEKRKELLFGMLERLGEQLPGSTLFIRYDLPWDLSHLSAESMAEIMAPLRKAPYDIQPPSTVVLSIDGEDDEILAGMKRKTRYNIRLAAKKGVKTSVYDARSALGEDAGILSAWYRLYRETAERDGIAIHAELYYRRLFEIAVSEGAEDSLLLVTAEHEGDLLAGIIVSVYGKTATYMYGASSNYKRNLMGSYAVQWEAMKTARRLGSALYDLFGIPPADDPSHPMHGLYRFKTGFGGRIIHRPGCWDYPLSAAGYGLYRGFEKLRYLYYKKMRKR